MIGEAKRLHALGFGIHWLRPKSKAPVESGWTTGDRKPWDKLAKTYTYGMNVGVRLGRVSRFADGTYLAVIDCDVKSGQALHLKEMEAKLAALVGAEHATTPQVISGRGNGSRHIYVRTRKPVRPNYYAKSTEVVRVHMPSARPSNKERSQLKEFEIKEGLRLRAAWEVSIMGEGQQVALPPSIHPDSGNAYAWGVPFKDFQELPLIELGGVAVQDSKQLLTINSEKLTGFTPVEVDIISSDLPDSVVNLILTGEGCTDKSTSVYRAAHAMHRHGFSDNEILTVLTDKDNYLGEAGFRHAKTDSRKRAAEWVKRYSLDTAKAKEGAQAAFVSEVEVTVLDDEGMVEQFEAIKSEQFWGSKVERVGGKHGGKPLPTLMNLILFITHTIGESAFRYNTFKQQMVYGCDTPWGGKADASITDLDIPRIKAWAAWTHRFEPSTGTVWDAIQKMAVDQGFHPVRDYLVGLPAWDGVGRISTALYDHLGGDNEPFYMDEVFTKWMVAAVKRVYEPGSKFDWMLILEGDQGLGKSSFFRILASEAFFLDKLPDLADKESAQALQGIWLVEMGELKELRKNEIETVKGFLTRQVDKFRPPYGRATIETPRQCVFAGSTNADQYLKDDTGNRRFVPVHITKSLDFGGLEKVRDQLWAEALLLYQTGLVTDLNVEGGSRRYMKELHAERMVMDDSDILVEKLQDFIDTEMKKPEKDRFNFQKFKLLVLFDDFGPFRGRQEDWKQVSEAAKAIKKIGGKKKIVHGKTFWEIPTPTHGEN